MKNPKNEGLVQSHSLLHDEAKNIPINLLGCSWLRPLSPPSASAECLSSSNNKTRTRRVGASQQFAWERRKSDIKLQPMPLLQRAFRSLGFIRRYILVICPVIVLKLAVTAPTSLPVQTLWPKRLKKIMSMTEKNKPSLQPKRLGFARVVQDGDSRLCSTRRWTFDFHRTAAAAGGGEDRAPGDVHVIWSSRAGQLVKRLRANVRRRDATSAHEYCTLLLCEHFPVLVIAI